MNKIPSVKVRGSIEDTELDTHPNDMTVVEEEEVLETSSDEESEKMVLRSHTNKEMNTRELWSRTIEIYFVYNNYFVSDPYTPENYHDASTCADRKIWMKAMKE